jgi:two-component system LytT family response regulator
MNPPPQSPIRTVIVDDEVWARRRLRVLLEDEGDVEIVAECADGDGAVRSIRREAPDLLFLDVQMSDMSGCDVLDAIGDAAPPAVIFVTAHERYALDAFEREAIDYLLKPFDESRFRSALTRARRHLTAGHVPPAAGHEESTAVRRPRFLRRLPVQRHGRVLFVDADEIDCIEAAGNYVSVRAASMTHLVRISLAALDRRLDPDRFVRIHRSTIVNWSRVQEIRPWSKGEQALRLTDGRELVIGRAYREAVVARTLLRTC